MICPRVGGITLQKCFFVVLLSVIDKLELHVFLLDTKITGKENDIKMCHLSSR